MEADVNLSSAYMLDSAALGLAAQRAVLADLLDQCRHAYAQHGSELRQLEVKLGQMANRLAELQTGNPVALKEDAAGEILDLEDQEVLGRQRQEWLAERLIEDQTSIAKLRTALQQLDDTVGYLTSQVSDQRDAGPDESVSLTSIRLLQAQEGERQRLAREIHDGPAQVLANTIFTLEYCERLWEKNPQQMKKELGRLKHEVRESLADVRYFISDLRPVALGDVGLEAALRKYVDEYQTRFGIKVRMVYTATDRLSGAQELAIYRIAQEAMQNIRKHSGASEVRMTVCRDGASFLVTIKDNGSGFDVDNSSAGQGRHFGLASMTERARLIGGQLAVSSGPEGTTVTLAFSPNSEIGTA